MNINKIFNREKSKIDYKGYNVQRDSYELILRLLILISGSGLILDIFVLKRAIPVIIILIVNLLIASGSLYNISKIRNFRFVSILTSAYIVFIMIPVFIVYGSKTSSSTPIWICVGIMVMFFILEPVDFLWMFLLAFYIESFLYVELYIRNGMILSIENRTTYFIGFIFSYVGACICLFLSVELQEKHFKIAKSKSIFSREREWQTGVVKTNFLSNMTSEFRMPMNNVIGLSELILKEEISDETRSEVERIKDSGYQLLEIIDDVLAYSKLDTGSFTLNFTEFEMKDLVTQIIDTMRNDMDMSGIILQADIDPNIPKKIYADDLRIKQIILTLFFISRSLTDSGRIMFSLSSDYSGEETFIINGCVSDTGCGLSKEDMDAISGTIDIYNTKQNSNLRGIMLKYNIIREILKLMNGKLSIRSIDGVGLAASFSFECRAVSPEPMVRVDRAENKNVLVYLTDERETSLWRHTMEGLFIRPRYVNSFYAFNKILANHKFDYIFVNDTDYAQISNSIESFGVEDSTYVITGFNRRYGDYSGCRVTPAPVTSISVSDILNDRWDQSDYVKHEESFIYDGSLSKILVVDDNNVNLRVAIGIFRHYKINIDIARSGDEALRKMADARYDLVFLDLYMPEMSGEETLRLIRNSKEDTMKNIPVIALTASSSGNVREEVLNMGFQEYLAKPIKQNYLIQMLTEFLPPEIFKKIKTVDKEQ